MEYITKTTGRRYVIMDYIPYRAFKKFMKAGENPEDIDAQIDFVKEIVQDPEITEDTDIRDILEIISQLSFLSEQLENLTETLGLSMKKV